MAPINLWAAWTLEPSVMVAASVTALLFAWGARNVWRRAGVGRGITARHCASLLGALLALAVALVSPLDALSGELFSAHMVQHMVLTFVTAPLLVMSDLPLALLWALPRRWARVLGCRWNRSAQLSRAWRVVSSPVGAWLLFTLAWWGWHTTVLYEAALRNETIHAMEHLAFIATAMLFWRVLVRHGGPNHVRYGTAIPYLFTSALQSGILGALMTFTSEPWYPYYTALVMPWGLTALQDQQLAGLIMWFPGSAVFSPLVIGYFAAWFRALEQRSDGLQRRDGLRTRQES